MSRNWRPERPDQTQVKKFDTCETFCCAAFHTTRCELQRQVLTVGMSSFQKDGLLALLKPYLFQQLAISPNASDKELLTRASDQLYERAILAQFLRAESARVRGTLNQIRAKARERGQK